MKDSGRHNRWLEMLRTKAEKITGGEASPVAVEHLKDVESLLHELHVYHVELEIQNQELREAQKLLELSRRRYFELFDLAPVGYLTLSEEGTIEEANLTACDLLKTDRLQVKNKPLVVFVQPEDHSVLYKHLSGVKECGKRRTTVIGLQPRSGSTVTVRMETAPVLTEDGQAKHLLVTLTDISDLIHTQKRLTQVAEELQISQRRLKIRSDVAHIFLTSSESHTFHRVLQLAARELGARSALLAIDDLDGPACTSVDLDEEGAQLAPEPSVSLSYGKLFGIWWEKLCDCPETTRLNGVFPEGSSSEFIENAVLAPLLFEDRFLGLLAIAQRAEPFTEEEAELVRMIAESLSPLIHARQGKAKEERERQALEETKRIMEQQLHEARRMETVGRLAGGIAHDFNNNLQVILGRTDILLTMISPSDSLYPHLEEIHQAGLRSAEMTRQLLAFARRQMISPRVLDLNESIEKSLKILRRLISQGIELVWKPFPNLWPVKMDPSQVDQVLVNLCVNARDAIPCAGRIVVQTRNVSLPSLSGKIQDDPPPGDYVLLSVSDTGVGMDQETLEKIFEPFFTTKEFGKGTGLGLATVYGIVKQNNGHIRVDSTLGVGTTFHIYIPRSSDVLSEFENDGKLPEVPKGQGETILVIEDDLGILTMVGAMLESLGYKAVVASHPYKAMEIALEHREPIHVIITDVIMPDMNGKVLAEKIHALRPEAAIIFMSGYISEMLLSQQLESARIAFLKKPFTRWELAVSVRKVLEKSHHLSSLQNPLANDKV